MITKCAFFQGTVKAGQEEAMRSYVEAELAPLWRGFQPSEDVKILFNVENDKNGPTIPLALIVTYKNQASLDQAMETEARFKARDMLPAFYAAFFDDVALLHYVFED
ncbi:MAG: hypothetical protein ABJK39_15405 [Hyphomicrobiales bacterium]